MSTLTIKSPKPSQISINMKNVERIFNEIYLESTKKGAIVRKKQPAFIIVKKAARK